MSENIYCIEKGFLVKPNVQVLGFDARMVKTYEDYLNLKNSGRLEDAIIYRDSGPNLVVDAGSAQLVALVTGSSTTSFSYCGVGSGTNSPAAGDTDLQTSITRTAVTNQYSVANVGHWDTFFNTSTGNGTWAETGIFTTASAGTGTMLCRKNITSFAKSSSNTANVAWSITFTPV